MIAKQCAEFAQASVEGFAVNLHGDVLREQLEIGNLHASAEMRFVSENGITDVVEMGNLRVVEEERVFNLARISNHAIVADNRVFANVSIVANLAIFSNDGRAFDHRAVLDKRAFADENVVTYISAAFAMIVQCRTEIGF